MKPHTETSTDSHGNATHSRKYLLLSVLPPPPLTFVKTINLPPFTADAGHRAAFGVSVWFRAADSNIRNQEFFYNKTQIDCLI